MKEIMEKRSEWTFVQWFKASKVRVWFTAIYTVLNIVFISTILWEMNQPYYEGGWGMPLLLGFCSFMILFMALGHAHNYNQFIDINKKVEQRTAKQSKPVQERLASEVGVTSAEAERQERLNKEIEMRTKLAFEIINNLSKKAREIIGLDTHTIGAPATCYIHEEVRAAHEGLQLPNTMHKVTFVISSKLNTAMTEWRPSTIDMIAMSIASWINYCAEIKLILCVPNGNFEVRKLPTFEPSEELFEVSFYSQFTPERWVEDIIPQLFLKKYAEGVAILWRIVKEYETIDGYCGVDYTSLRNMTRNLLLMPETVIKRFNEDLVGYTYVPQS